jgi:ferric-dicitrate binding protein FerR (iron transport regulator)
MTKIAVGIGEDFPADDSKPAPDGDRRPHDDARCAARREAYRKWREQRRQWKRQWRNELRARTRTARAPLRDSIRADQDDPPRRQRGFDQNKAILWAIIGIIAVIAAISFIFAHLFMAVGVVALLALFAAYYRGDEPFGFAHDGALASAPQQAAN